MEIVHKMELTDKERKLIDEIRNLPYGQTHIIVWNEKGQPVRIELEKVKESRKL